MAEVAERSNVIIPSKIDLQNHHDYSEDWLEGIIHEDPTMLGLGELVPIESQRRQEAGRLDLLFRDNSHSSRYVVELMLGELDPSHIIRTIEYWDIERRKYPSYDHFAVIVAENITARFLNVLSLCAGNIPLIALQMEVLEMDDRLALNFVEVLDQRSLRNDDEREKVTPTDRQYWEERATPETVQIADWTLEMINGEVKVERELNYNKVYIGLTTGTKARNFMYFVPKKEYTHIGAEVNDREKWETRMEDVGLPVTNHDRKLKITVKPGEWEEYEESILELVKASVKHYES